MNLFGILFGFIFSIFPLIILARIFKRKFLFISNPYMKGALMGFIFWVIIAILFYIDAVYGIFGMLGKKAVMPSVPYSYHQYMVSSPEKSS